MSARTVVIKLRGCGRRVEGGVYLIGGKGGSENGVLAHFNRITPPVPYQVKLHRGPRIVDQYAILSRQPLEKWWLGASQDTEEKKNADAWAIETFGMTLARRLSTGECAGTKSADDALAVLVSKVRLDRSNRYLTKYLREITAAKIQELPRVAEHYAFLHEQLALFLNKESTVGRLIAAQAAVWRIAYALPPSRRKEFVPYLAGILVLLNLPKDAMAMQKTFR